MINGFINTLTPSSPENGRRMKLSTRMTSEYPTFTAYIISMHAICKNTVTLQAVSFAPGDLDHDPRPANLLDGNICRVMCEDNLTAIQMDKQRQLIETSMPF
jgi:hypothetical protein